jgi:hypothetical protein
MLDTVKREPPSERVIDDVLDSLRDLRRQLPAERRIYLDMAIAQVERAIEAEEPPQEPAFKPGWMR